MFNNDPKKVSDPLDYFVDANNQGYFWISHDDKKNFTEVKKYWNQKLLNYYRHL